MERRQHAPVRRTTAWSAALLALCLLVLAACGGGPKADTPDKPDFRRYVALGDSYTSGPGIEAVARRVATAIEDVQKKAPHATVVLVGYPRIVPDSGSCPSLLPLPDAMLERLRQALALMNDEWQKVAKATGADYVDMYAVSK